MAIVPLSDLLGQPAVAAFLKQVVAGGRPANAYLFHGPAGVGKGTAALAFARALMCERTAGAPPAAPGLFDAAPAPPAGSGDDACGACPACVRTATLQHPDLKLLFPVSGEEKELDETLESTRVALCEDPYHVFVYERFASIRLSMTRELLREMAYKPYEGARRVVVVRDADRMREDQYSALLKSIEEPGAATVWILTTARLGRLPATIRSRCQRVRFAPLTEAALQAFFEGRLGLDTPVARMLAALAGGSLARGLMLREEDPRELRNASLALLEPALSGDAATLWRSAQGLARSGRQGRESLRRMAEFHMLWLRDLLRARHDVPREALVNRDREKELKAQSARVDAAEVRRRLMVLEEMLRAIEGNVTPETALFSGLLRVAGSRVGEGAWPRHATSRWEY